MIVILIGVAITSGCSVSASVGKHGVGKYGVGKYGVGMSAHLMN